MANVTLPYPNLGEALGVSLDLGKVPHKKLREHSILVDGSQAGDEIRVGIDVQVPSGIVELFPPSERKSPPLDVLATVVSIDGGMREPIPLKRLKSSLYAGAIKLDRTRVRESARVRVYAVRAINGSATGFARWKGSRLAWAPESEIQFLEHAPKGNFLSIVWEDFSSSTVIPSHFDEAMYYVDTAADPPVLYLNRLAAPPLIKLFDTEGHGHAKALPRDLVFRSVASNVWLTLAHAALHSLHEEAQAGTPVDLETAFEGSWKKEMIELLAPSLNPGLMAEEAVLELCTKIDDRTYYAETFSRAQLAIQTDQAIRLHYERFAEKVFENG